MHAKDYGNYSYRVQFLSFWFQFLSFCPSYSFCAGVAPDIPVIFINYICSFSSGSKIFDKVLLLFYKVTKQAKILILNKKLFYVLVDASSSSVLVTTASKVNAQKCNVHVVQPAWVIVVGASAS